MQAKLLLGALLSVFEAIGDPTAHSPGVPEASQYLREHSAALCHVGHQKGVVYKHVHQTREARAPLAQRLSPVSRTNYSHGSTGAEVTHY